MSEPKQESHTIACNQPTPFKVDRRTFLGASLLASAGAALTTRLNAEAAHAPAGLPPAPVGEDCQAISRKRDKCLRIASFDPAVGAVQNPGMGVSGYVFSDHMHVGYDDTEWNRTQGLPPKPLDRESFDRMVNLPHVDNLYIRVEWADIQREKGKLHLPDSWNWMLEAVEKRGKAWAFRIMNISPHSMRANQLPEFLQGNFKMIPYWERDNVPGPRPKYFPEYSAEYLKWWGELVALLGDAFDKHPLLEFADVSGYGMWGEFHHGAMYEREGGPFLNWEPDNVEEVIERLIHDHLGAFPLTPAVLGLHASDWNAGLNAFDQGLCWARRDSFMQSFSTSETRIAQGLRSGSAMVWETIMPNESTCPTDGAPFRPNSYSLAQRYFDIQAHYAAVGFNPWDMIWAHEHCGKVLSQLAQNLGYRLRPSVIWRRIFNDGKPELILGLRNDGCSPPPGQITVHAEFPEGKTTSIELPIGQPAPGAMHLYAMPYLAQSQSSEIKSECKLSLSLRMKGKTSPVRWAANSPPDEDLRYLRFPLA